VVEAVETERRTDEDLDRLDQRDSSWVTIVWNDPVNLMSYVSYVFRSYFGYPEAEAQRLMMLVHTEGRAVVASGGREQMERHVEAMHDFGLWATLTRDDA
jgi:ATP-dependent Clp protease adaptor protein ClpS